jgi:Cu-Zn family superoxide dismutase
MHSRLLLLAGPVLLLTACGDHTVPSSDAMVLPSAPAATATATGSPTPPGTTEGTFLPWTAGATAITYDPAVVPPGATAKVVTARTEQGVSVRLTVTGMIPRRAYGAHLHAMPCDAMPDAAGSHYQHSADPSMPSVDPSFANPDNEVWLDFTADTTGAATVSSDEAWTFDAGRPPRSLVIHAQVTRTQAGEAGTAGPRVACLTLPTT